MNEKSRQKITRAMHSIHHELAIEANKVSRIKALILEYLPPEARGGGQTGRRVQIEAELRRFACEKN